MRDQVPEFLSSIVPAGAVQPSAVLVRLIAAWLFGCLVAFVYRRTRPRSAIVASFPGTLILLSVLIAMVTQVIGDNIARAFSLVGALSIVRFRTVVRDTQDTAYVIFAVAVGMAVGAEHLWVAISGFGVTAAAAFAMRPNGVSRAGLSYAVDVRIGLGLDAETVVRPVLDRHLSEAVLVGVTTARQGLAIDLSYTGLLKPGSAAETLVRELNRIDGVDDVRVNRASAVE